MPTLNWLTREDDIRAAEKVPYRLLEEVPALSAGDPASENMLIQGDNLEALKSLLPYYRGAVKCIYIDPPYNTRSAFEHYDDNLEHSQWLAMMWPRLELLRELLSEDGSIWVSIDDNEGHYLKVIMDEVFGRRNFINDTSARMKLAAGASGGGEDKRLKKNVEHLFAYAKSYDAVGGFETFNDVYAEEDLFALIDEMEAAGQSWKYTSVLVDRGTLVESREIKDGSGEPIVVERRTGLKRTTIRELEKQGSPREVAYLQHFESVFSDTNAQTSIRQRIIDEFGSLADDELLVARYVPRSGREKGQTAEHLYISPSIRRVIWLADTAERRGARLVKREKLGTLWEGFALNNLTKEGAVQFPNGKKPEALLERVLQLATNPGDLVLDSFLGSGTTAAVAQKMGRRYIGIEMGEHAVTHCAPRLVKVIEGEQGGISRAQNWQGGGGFRFYKLGPKVFDEQGRIREGIGFLTLAAHVWFSETHHPWHSRKKTPLLGAHDSGAIALLYNGVLGDKSVNGGNVLTRKTLDIIRQDLPPGFALPLTIYGERCALGAATLKAGNIIFKQTPYDVKARR